jgi:uncharacterized surface protein with fasciclin (FAS1) repeats
MKILFRLGTLIAIFFTIGFFSSSKAADLMDLIKSEPDLSLFLEAVTYGRADNVFNATESTPIVGAFVPFTLFAPNNAAMQSAGYTSDKMKATATAEGFVATNPKTQSKSLRGLVKLQTCMKKALKQADLKGELERFEGGNLKIQGKEIKGKTTTATIVKPDLTATNGILQITNAVLD